MLHRVRAFVHLRNRRCPVENIMPAAIISIGNELTSGLTVNTNATWLSAQLATCGVTVACHVTIGDDRAAISDAIRRTAQRCDVVIVSGGLGPTLDDVTRQALADVLGEPLVEDPAALANLEQFFKKINRPMAPSNRVQALRPASAACLENHCGTAPGLRARLGNSEIFIIPGVPREMRAMFSGQVAPELAAHSGGRVTLTAKLNTFGAGESWIGEQIADLMRRGAVPSVGTTVHDGVVSIRIYAEGEKQPAEKLLRDTSAIVRQRLGALVFSEDDDTLQLAVYQLMVQQKLTVATAESCTGGLLAEFLTDVPGSGNVFAGGFVVYTNTRKREDLDVPAEMLMRHGAVSEAVALALATGAQHRTGADFGIGVTGIAGPEAVEGKPVGLVWIAIADKHEARAHAHHFSGERAAVRQRAAQMALARLRWKLLGLPAPPGA